MTHDFKAPASVSPFGNIALAFSGGGFRAAAFSLGALSYFDQIKLPDTDTSNDDLDFLGNVSYISSTSGGSFTNALYSSYLHKGKSFKDVYNKIMKEIADQNLLEAVFLILNDDKQWSSSNSKHRNIINAFAKAYDKLLFEEETFGIFWNKKYIPKFEVCFNTTEFYRGLSFRFQTEGNDNYFQVIGNNYLYFNTKKIETIKKIKLADIVAASSCFPAGFEPIIYPEDFTYSQNGNTIDIKELQNAMLFENYQEEINNISSSYGFMDGGITDNQGLYSVMLADKKRRNRENDDPFDLIIITDVTSYFMDGYKVPMEEFKPEWRQENLNYYLYKIKNTVCRSIKVINWLTVSFTLLFFLGISAVFLSGNKALAIIASFVSGGFITVLLIIFRFKRIDVVKWILKNKQDIISDSFINRKVKKQKLFSEEVIRKLIKFLKISKISFLEQMIKARISSLLSLVLDINLKQTRRLIYEMFYNEPIWDNRRIPNFIYELSTYNIASRVNRFNNPNRLKWVATNEDKILFLDNCDKLNKVAEEARMMGTTLWFDENDSQNEKLKKIVAAGQFTTCCNLLEYMVSLERKGIQFDFKVTKQLFTLKKRVIEDFNHFKTDPFYLFDILGK